MYAEKKKKKYGMMKELYFIQFVSHKFFRVKIDTLYEPIAKRLIVMIIDALRWDFIEGSVGKIAMPITSSLIVNSSAYLLRTKVQPPTVTMPRIKVPDIK